MSFKGVGSGNGPLRGSVGASSLGRLGLVGLVGLVGGVGRVGRARRVGRGRRVVAGRAQHVFELRHVLHHVADLDQREAVLARRRRFALARVAQHLQLGSAGWT